MKDRQSNVLSLLEDKTNDYARKVALGIKTNFGWEELTFDGLGLLSRRLASYLINDLGIQKGEKLAILSESKPEFGVCIFASVLAGTITVPLDIKLTIYELTSILSDCMPSVMLVSQHYLEKAKELQQAIPSIKHIIVMDERPESEDGLQSIYTIPMNYSCKWRHRARNSRMFIIYTSGTTGSPKGVETTFGNILAQLKDMKGVLNPVLPKKKDFRVISILPMNHLFEMTVGFSTFLNMGVSVYYTQSLKPKDILNAIKDKKINAMVLVPAFLKLLKTTLEAEIRNAPPFYQKTFPLRYHIAKFLPYRWIKKLMFKRLHDCFGGSFKWCISGGAPLDMDVAKFFRRIGIEVYQGYGLTETSPVATISFDKDRDIRSVGKVLPSFDAKIDKETGELLLKGPSVMRGYHHQPELTAEAIDKDGWFHTKIDEKRQVFITGRIKNMIVLSGGKKVFPEEVEAVLETSDMFSELCVFGTSREGGAKDGTEDIAVVIVPKQELIENHSMEELNKIVRDEVRKRAQRLAPYKRPINITVLKEALPRTATRKIQRKKVKELVEAS